MRKWKWIIGFLLVVLTVNVGAIVTLAAESSAGSNYILNYYLPAYKTYTYYKTSQTPTACNSAITGAISTWNAVDSSMQFTLAGTVQTEIDTEDFICTIGSYLSEEEFEIITGSAASVAGNMLYHYSDSLIYASDIMFNGYFNFGNGQGTYNDYRGILTHELGHTWGLDDIYEGDEELDVASVNELPTMFGSVNYSGYSSNVSVFLRTLTNGDINGLREVKEQKGW